LTKPLIGIGTDVQMIEGERDRAFVYLTYAEALRNAGAMPVLIPPQPENAAEVIESLDGILLAGGDDCDPRLYGQQPHPSLEPMDPRRQENDFALARMTRERGIPTLGICLGVQMMNVAAGGDLFQDIDSEVKTTVRHASDPENRERHDVNVTAGTKLAAILGTAHLDVNSSHHQAVRRVGEGLQVTAHARDGVIEGLEDPAHPFYIGVQWHPEDMTGEGSAVSLFEAFVNAARRHAEKKKQ
jgi:putative glutamine amidotransferase